MKYIHLFIAFFLLLGCETDPLSSDEAVAVRLIPSLGDSAPAGTRVVDQTWYTTDIVGVSISSAPNDYKQYNPTADGTSVTLEPVTADQTLYYPADDSPVTFRAFCPYPTVPANLAGSIVTYKDFEDQSESLKMQAVDLVYTGDATGSKSSPTQTLEFKHRFSKVVISVTSGTDGPADLTDLEMTLTNMPKSVTFDLSNGQLGAASTEKIDISPFHDNTKDVGNAMAIVVPHDSGDDRKITFLVNGINYSHTIASDFKFEEKKEYIFKFTLTRTAATLIGNKIVDWGEDDLAIWDNEKNWLTVTPTEVSYYKEGRDGNTIVIRTNHPAKPGIRYSKLAFEPDNAEPQIDWLSAPTNGTLEQTNDTSPYEWTFTYNVAEYTDGTTIRIGYIQFSIGSMTVPTKVVQSTISESDPTITYVDGNTNCFIVKPGTTIIFPLTRPFDPAIQRIPGEEPKATSTFDVDILWDDTAGKAVSSVLITDASKGPDAHVTVVAGNNSGNALIAIRDETNSDEIVWSYHIWVTDYNPYAATFTNTNSIGTKFIFMDRNLGATEAGFGNLPDDNYGLGLFYQWGRKDPFPATKNPGDMQPGSGSFTAVQTTAVLGTVPNAIKNPNVFYFEPDKLPSPPYDWHYNSRDNDLWGHLSNKKTIYDPCPAGWCVPKNSGMSDDTSPWYGFNEFGVFSYGYTWGTNAVYPNVSSRVYSTGNLDNSILPGRVGYWWSASPRGSTSSASAMHIPYSGGSASLDVSRLRAFGCSVRCVRE